MLLLRNGDALFFFAVVLVVGMSSAITENFAYVRLREVGGGGNEMGVCRFVSSVAGAPMFWFSKPLIKRLDSTNRVLVIALMSYVFRFLVYGLMQHPYQALPAEALRGINFALFWSGCTIHASQIAPPGFGATMVRTDQAKC